MPSDSAFTSLDMKKIEDEAIATARKHVANMLQRPDQLEKVEQYKYREMRKKISVDGVLKTAMQTQLDGVRTGLHQLAAALDEIQCLNAELDAIPEKLIPIGDMVQNLKALKIESKEYSQCAAALENLEHILNIPKSVQEAMDFITEGKLLNAHQCLAILENSRDDLLFEMHKLPNQSPTDQNVLKHYFSDVEKLSEELSKQLWLILGRTLNSVRKEPKVIVNALRIIEREESVDIAACSRFERYNYMPIGRPKRWRIKAFEILKQCVQERIEGNQFEERNENKMWLVRYLEVTRQLVVEDLRVVKTACIPCFPPKYQIFEEFVKMYHFCLSNRLIDLVENKLEDNEYITLLTWLSTYGSPEMLGHPDLNIDVLKLTPLLGSEVVEGLISQYLHNVEKNYRDWMRNILATDYKDWQNDAGPEQNESGEFHTQLPLIMSNMLDQHLQVAETVSKELVNRMMLLSIEEVNEFTKRYEEYIIVYKNKHFENRSVLKHYTDYMIATANNCLQFCLLADKLRQRYCKDLTIISSNAENLFCKTIESFVRLACKVLKCLRLEVFTDLTNHLADVMTRTWFLSANQTVDTISATLDDYGVDYTHLHPENFSLLVTDLINQVAMSYIHSVLQRRLSFKNYEDRRLAAEKICVEGKMFQQLFDRPPFNQLNPSWFKRKTYYNGKISMEKLVLKHGPIQYVSTNSPFEALPLLAEVLKLRDISMLSLEISGVLRHYPDISQEQLVSLILLRGDVSKNDAKQLVSDMMAEIEIKSEGKTIFADIPIFS